VAVSHWQLYELLKYCMDFGKIMLEHSGEFYPFGAVIDADGKIRTRGGDDGNEYPNPLDIYQLLSDSFTRDVRAGHVLAIALAANANIPSDYELPSPDGLRVLLEFSLHIRALHPGEEGILQVRGLTHLLRIGAFPFREERILHEDKNCEVRRTVCGRDTATNIYETRRLSVDQNRDPSDYKTPKYRRAARIAMNHSAAVEMA